MGPRPDCVQHVSLESARLGGPGPLRPAQWAHRATLAVVSKFCVEIELELVAEPVQNAASVCILRKGVTCSVLLRYAVLPKPYCGALSSQISILPLFRNSGVLQ